MIEDVTPLELSQIFRSPCFGSFKRRPDLPLLGCLFLFPDIAKYLTQQIANFPFHRLWAVQQFISSSVQVIYPDFFFFMAWHTSFNWGVVLWKYHARASSLTQTSGLSWDVAGLFTIASKCSFYLSVPSSFVFDSFTVPLLLQQYHDYFHGSPSYFWWFLYRVLMSLFFAASSALDASFSKYCRSSFLQLLLTSLSFSAYWAANLSFKRWEVVLNILSLVSLLAILSKLFR